MGDEPIVAPPTPSRGATPWFWPLVAGVLRWVVVIVVLAVAALAYLSSQMSLLLLLAVVAGAAWGLLVRALALLRGRLRRLRWRGPIEPSRRGVRLQAANRALFWAAAGLTFAWVAPRFVDPEITRPLVAVVAVATLLNIAMALLVEPAGRVVRASWSLLPMLGWIFLAVECLRIAAGPPGPAVALAAPFEGVWIVGQGGRSALVNHHYPIPAQSHALDLVKLVGGRARVGDPRRRASYPAFGATLRAPADGRVVRAVDGHPDMVIGETDVESLVGNHVVIEIGPDRYVLLAHLQNGSVAVREGQAVRAGEVVGRCGNSGNTSQPHLHLQVQNQADFRAPGLRTYPMTFHPAPGGAGSARPPRRNDLVSAPAPPR